MNENVEEHTQRNERVRQQMSQLRANETEEQRESRNEANRNRMRHTKSNL